MNQITLALEAAATEPSTFDATGFEIGWDHARFRLTPPAEHLLADHPVRQGWEAGRSTFGRRTRRPPRPRRSLRRRRLRGASTSGDATRRAPRSRSTHGHGAATSVRTQAGQCVASPA